GEQPVTNNEIYAYTTTGEDTFGYVPRYAEYKYMPSRVAGDFRTTLDYWHLGRKFDTQPTLSTSFVECDPTKRIS
ncbi:major capsid protein, partial [Acinetobacter baylyi]|uniref:major capsid protein n=1 Tax=Acinetobacter baylyi TaxID=202950 RepID=UPI001C092B08